jgi:hypothetical protein
LGNPKVASASGLADLVCAVAQGRGPEIKELLTEYAGTPGAVNFMFDTVKGASLVKTSALNKNLAITWLMTDPILSTVVEPLSAAEYYGWVPHCKVASFIDPEWQDDLVALTEGVVQETRRAMYAPLIDAMPEGLRKMASSLGPLRSPIMQKIVVADTLNRLLLGNQSHQNEAGTSANVSDDSAANAVPGFEANRPTIEAEGTEANKFLNSNKDVVDDALSRAGNNIGNNIGNGKGESGLGTQAAQMQ